MSSPLEPDSDYEIMIDRPSLMNGGMLISKGPQGELNLLPVHNIIDEDLQDPINKATPATKVRIAN